MIVIGDISGIQNYVFDIAETGGGQARRLRARSFFVQLLAETAALRVRRALGWLPETVLLCGAGKFTLRGPGTGLRDGILTKEQQAINNWLLRTTRGELRLTLAWADAAESDEAAYRAAQSELQQRKARPWAPPAGASWADSRLILDPLDTPCSLCHHAPASTEEVDPDGIRRLVCDACNKTRELGRLLPRARWLVIRDVPTGADLEMLGLGIDVVTSDSVTVTPGTLAVANLREPEKCPSWCHRDRFMQRRLMAHVPVNDEGQPVWFTELADAHSQGAALLAVLKADADSLGVCFDRLLNSNGLDAMRALSDRLDAFFAGRLRRELSIPSERWHSIYTVFAGGDDLVMIGPWDIMVDFAGAVRQWFAEEFSDLGLTLSASLELIKPKRPIKPAVERAESLLNETKKAGKDRLAALGQIWPWKNHEQIIDQAKKLAGWVESGAIERGWLHTLLALAMTRHGDEPDPLATAHLAYHVDRNWKQGTPSRHWANQLVNDFDDREQFHVRYLPAIVRYALTATRKRDEED
ncbi:MAG TPA: type III-A CRISPR-associated protein Cas10/Csm1 [Phycisphaerae bacterium]|nr:type III-A CRISPR-associated protein Cas10/Csm1 [Phycisphaerae bacterium]